MSRGVCPWVVGGCCSLPFPLPFSLSFFLNTTTQETAIFSCTSTGNTLRGSSRGAVAEKTSEISKVCATKVTPGSKACIICEALAGLSPPSLCCGPSVNSPLLMS